MRQRGGNYKIEPKWENGEGAICQLEANPGYREKNNNCVDYKIYCRKEESDKNHAKAVFFARLLRKEETQTCRSKQYALATSNVYS